MIGCNRIKTSSAYTKIPIERIPKILFNVRKNLSNLFVIVFILGKIKNFLKRNTKKMGDL